MHSSATSPYDIGLWRLWQLWPPQPVASHRSWPGPPTPCKAGSNFDSPLANIFGHLCTLEALTSKPKFAASFAFIAVDMFFNHYYIDINQILSVCMNSGTKCFRVGVSAILNPKQRRQSSFSDVSAYFLSNAATSQGTFESLWHNLTWQHFGNLTISQCLKVSMLLIEESQIYTWFCLPWHHLNICITSKSA